jgi:hypothetical protein
MPRECIVYPEFRTSKSLAEFTWMQCDFFCGLLILADPKGRFEAEVCQLRAALFTLILSNVLERNVDSSLATCPRNGLVKLWIYSDGRGYSEVGGYKTGLNLRESNLPAPSDGPLDHGCSEEKYPWEVSWVALIQSLNGEMQRRQ